MDPVYFCLMFSPEMQGRWVGAGNDPGKACWEIMMSADDANEAIGHAIDFMSSSDDHGCAVVYFCPEDGVGIIWRDGMNTHECLAALNVSNRFVRSLCLELAKRSLLIRQVHMSVEPMLNKPPLR